MWQTEESSRRLSPSGVRKRWEKIRGIEDEDDDEYENDIPRMSGSSSLPEPGTIVLCHFSIGIGTVAGGLRT
jgi:hypothetical protein